MIGLFMLSELLLVLVSLVGHALYEQEHTQNSLKLNTFTLKVFSQGNCSEKKNVFKYSE